MLAASGCVIDTSYTLYQTAVNTASKSEVIGSRVYVATFDYPRSVDEQTLDSYNRTNCGFAEKLFNAEQPYLKGGLYENIRIHYWCEKGGYRPKQ